VFEFFISSTKNKLLIKFDEMKWWIILNW
jgi:hypothetical protein